MTNANLHSCVNAIIKPVKKIDTYSNAFPNLSPMPCFTVSISLNIHKSQIKNNT